MMTRGLRDQENTRINNILQRVMSMTGGPDSALNDELKGLAITVEVLESMSAVDIWDHLQRMHSDAENSELFADFLVQKGNLSLGDKNSYHEKAKMIYRQIQKESNVFSLSIQNKLLALN